MNHTSIKQAITKHCLMTIDDYKTKFAQHLYQSGEEFYIYIDNGSNILSVAHLDNALNPVPNPIPTSPKQHTLQHHALDDRLGVFTILELLPKLGVITDILLTTNEEVGRSTSDLFMLTHPSIKQYNWIVEFDRTGTDIAMYNCLFNKSYPQFVGSILPHYFPNCDILDGTYTDITTITRANEVFHITPIIPTAFNLGVGYYGEHTYDCFVNLDVYIKQIAQFVRFYDNYHDILIPFTLDDIALNEYYTNDEPNELCELCTRNEITQVIPEFYICNECAHTYFNPHGHGVYKLEEEALTQSKEHNLTLACEICTGPTVEYMITNVETCDSCYNFFLDGLAVTLNNWDSTEQTTYSNDNEYYNP